MPRRTKELSIKELRRELAAREKQVNGLLARRGKLAASLADVDARIAALGGGTPAARRGRPKAAGKGRPKAAATGNGRKRARRRATGKPLADYVVDVLTKAGKPLRVKDAMAAVTKAGYQSASKDFYGIVAAALRDDSRIKKISRGVYTLA
ncbi:MAG TPA: hypothetical protein VM695_09515 [Phycisphaerae bacterium]|nr:hypothetical protein [Phycisphaerae bacterium]